MSAFDPFQTLALRPKSPILPRVEELASTVDGQGFPDPLQGETRCIGKVPTTTPTAQQGAT